MLQPINKPRHKHSEFIHKRLKIALEEPINVKINVNVWLKISHVPKYNDCYLSHFLGIIIEIYFYTWKNININYMDDICLPQVIKWLKKIICEIKKLTKLIFWKLNTEELLIHFYEGNNCFFLTLNFHIFFAILFLKFTRCSRHF